MIRKLLSSESGFNPNNGVPFVRVISQILGSGTDLGFTSLLSVVSASTFRAVLPSEVKKV
jgi:NhaP-type Na+/H+ or K+/H+ antiporter